MPRACRVECRADPVACAAEAAAANVLTSAKHLDARCSSAASTSRSKQSAPSPSRIRLSIAPPKATKDAASAGNLFTMPFFPSQPPEHLILLQQSDATELPLRKMSLREYLTSCTLFPISRLSLFPATHALLPPSTPPIAPHRVLFCSHSLTVFLQHYLVFARVNMSQNGDALNSGGDAQIALVSGARLQP